MKLTEEELAELEGYAELDGTHVGTAVNYLLSLSRVQQYFLTVNMTAALQNELREQLHNYREYATIEERTETITRTVKELNWA